MQIIGFAGVAGVGKSTAAFAAAEALYEKGYYPIIEQFAGPLKKAAQLMGWEKGGPYDAQYREFCLYAGTMARKLDPDWWVKLFGERLVKIQEKESQALTEEAPWRERIILVDDIRFHNEVKAIEKTGGHLMFISSGDRVDKSAEWRNHESEALATQYEKGELADTLFGFTTDGSGPLADFQTVIATFAVQVVADPREMTR